MLRIQPSIEAGCLRLVLSGRIEAEHLAELQRLIEAAPPEQVVTLDLKEVRLVDRDAVHFLARCEASGTRLDGCPAYVREWIRQEGTVGEDGPSLKRR